MTWVKISDDALSDPKVFALDRSARLLHLEALAYSNRYGLDGKLPRAALRMLTDVTDAEPMVDQLVTAGCWTATNGFDGWQLVWWLDHQPTAEEMAAHKEHNRVRQERHRLHIAGDHSKCDPKRCWALLAKKGKGNGAAPRDSSRVTNDVTNDTSDPTRPDPTGGRDGEESAAPSGHATADAARPPVADIEVQRQAKKRGKVQAKLIELTGRGANDADLDAVLKKYDGDPDAAIEDAERKWRVLKAGPVHSTGHLLARLGTADWGTAE